MSVNSKVTVPLGACTAWTSLRTGYASSRSPQSGSGRRRLQRGEVLPAGAALVQWCLRHLPRAPLDGSAAEANPGYFVGEPRGPRLLEVRIATREGVRSEGGHSALLPS